MFASLLSTAKKYSEVVVFGLSLGVSGYMCATGSVTQCVSVVTALTNAVTTVSAPASTN